MTAPRPAGASRRLGSAPRRVLLLAVLAAALTAVLAGLARIGVAAGWGPAHALDHGPLFVLGAFGTGVALERAVALSGGTYAGARALLPHVAPVLGAAAAVALLARSPVAGLLSAASALALMGVNALLVARQPAPFTWMMLGGSAALLLGAGAWTLGRPVHEVAPAWLCFFVLTIAAERLELSRVAPTPRWAARALVTLGSLALALALARTLGWRPASRGLGAVLGAIGLWQLSFDVARRTVRIPGLPRFAAFGVLLGSGWLVLDGVLLAAVDLPAGGPLYDAGLHMIFVGYVLSMVFAHAPIVLPAVARLEVVFTRALYLPLAVLHLGLGARIAGDLLVSPRLRQAGAVVMALALGLYLALLAVPSLRRARG